MFNISWQASLVWHILAALLFSLNGSVTLAGDEIFFGDYLCQKPGRFGQTCTLSIFGGEEPEALNIQNRDCGFLPLPMESTYSMGINLEMKRSQQLETYVISRSELMPVLHFESYLMKDENGNELEDPISTSAIAFHFKFSKRSKAQLSINSLCNGKLPARTKCERIAHINKPLVTRPLITKPLITKPLITKPLITKPLITKPLITKPLIENPPIETPLNDSSINEHKVKVDGEAQVTSAIEQELTRLKWILDHEVYDRLNPALMTRIIDRILRIFGVFTFENLDRGLMSGVGTFTRKDNYKMIQVAFETLLEDMRIRNELIWLTQYPKDGHTVIGDYRVFLASLLRYTDLDRFSGVLAGINGGGANIITSLKGAETAGFPLSMMTIQLLNKLEASQEGTSEFVARSWLGIYYKALFGLTNKAAAAGKLKKIGFSFDGAVSRSE